MMTLNSEARRWLKWTAVVCVGLFVAGTLASAVVLWAIKPRPLADKELPSYVLGPRCSDEAMGTGDKAEKAAINRECRFDWNQELLGKTYTRETWPIFWWELL